MRWVLGIGMVVLACVSGCSVTSWDADAKAGHHETTWNHGLVIGFSAGGFELYIGPSKGSVTKVENDFDVEAAGGPAPEPESPPGAP